MQKSVTELRPHPLNARIYGADEIAAEFVASVRERGILVPLAIKADGTIISGHRRWQAARAIGMVIVPVEVVDYADELEERQAIIEFNRQREKTFSQKMAEAEELKAIESEQARRRMSVAAQAQRQGMQTFADPAKGTARDKVAEMVGLGSGENYRKAAKIWAAAKQGDEKAREFVAKIDAGRGTVHEAYRAVVEGAVPHVAYNSGNNEWYTPAEYVKAARIVMGSIDLDPASSPAANEVVCATRFFTAEEDGLKQEWVGKVWMNPPYSGDLIGAFCGKLARHVRAQTVTEAIVLVNNATETGWFSSLIEVAHAVVFPRGRVKFWGPQGQAGAPLQGQAVIYVGPKPQAFLVEFGAFGWGALL